MQQSGNIPVFPLPQDYIMGGESAIKVQERTTDWTKYLPSVEKQYAPTFDTLSCTSFSFCNVVETQLNYMLANNELPAESVTWLTNNGYIAQDGKVNLSDRFLAISSNTKITGNDFRTVAECARTVGLIPETDLPFGGTTWDTYHDKTLITEKMKQKASDFLLYIDIAWEWAFFDSAVGFNEAKQVLDSIKQAPMQIGIATPATHATTLYGYNEQGSIFKVFDTYEPFFFENVADAYNPQIGARIIVSAKAPKKINLPPKTFVFTQTLTKGSKGQEVVLLQQVLISEGLLKAGLDTGNFFDITLQAVKNFQMKYGITPTGNVGPITRAKLNSILQSAYSDTKKKLSISQDGINLIKKFEGLGDGNRKTSVLDPYKDIVGYWTIGYGNRYIDGVEVNAKTPPITMTQALELLKKSVLYYERIVQDSIKVSLTQNQYDALCSFCFNLGNINGLKDKVNAGTITRGDFMLYVKAKGVTLPALVSRRKQEADYYFS